MPSLPFYPITGGQALGDALSSGAHDYMQQKLQQDALIQAQARQDSLREQDQAQADKDYARRRQDQLTDVQSARQYEDQRTANATENQLNFMQAQSQEEIHRHVVQLLIDTNHLDPSQANNPQAITAALLAAKQDGDYDKYKELLTTPGPEGRPLLDWADAHDKAKVDAAMQLLNNRKARILQTQDTNTVNAQRSADKLASSIRQDERNIDLFQQQIAKTPDELYPITEDQIRTEAIQLAKATHKDQSVPASDKEIAQNLAAARAAIQARNDAKYAQAIPAMKEQARIIESKLNFKRSELGDYMKLKNPIIPSEAQFQDFQDPTQGLNSGTNLMAAPPPTGSAFLSNILAQVKPAPAPAPVTAPAPAPSPAFDNPQNDPLLAAANARSASNDAARASAIKQSQFLDPISELTSKIQQAKQTTATIRQRALSPQTGFAFNPIEAAQSIQRIEAQQTQWEQQLQKLQSQLNEPQQSAGVPPMAQTATPGASPMVSNADESAPQFSSPAPSAQWW